MILAGTLDGAPEPVTVVLHADVSDFTACLSRAALDTAKAVEDFDRQLVATARKMLTLDALLEVIGLSVDQVWATYYVRGAMDPEFAAPQFRDHYLRALLNVGGERGRAAVTGFLAGWTQHRAAALEPVEAFAWHRYMAGVELQVSAA